MAYIINLTPNPIISSPAHHLFPKLSKIPQHTPILSFYSQSSPHIPKLSISKPLTHSKTPSLSSFTVSSLKRPEIPLLIPILSFHSQSTPHIPKPSISKTLALKKTPSLRSIRVTALKSLSEVESEPVSGEFGAESGVYAVYDKNGDLQFIGISRNVAASVNTHRRAVPELCVSVKVGLVENPDKTALTQAWKSWMEEHIAATGKVPPGNESGNTTWVRAAPQQKKRKSDLRLTPGRHVSLTVPLEKLIDELVKENKVVAFIKGSRGAPQCGFSQRVIGILENEGVDYESVDVLDEEYNNGLRETLKKYSSWPTFPQVFVNGELLGGCDILSAMYEKGELATLFKK